MQSALVTGCNRGLGLGLVSTLAKKYPRATLLAACRKPQNAPVSVDTTHDTRHTTLSTGAVHVDHYSRTQNGSIQNDSPIGAIAQLWVDVDTTLTGRSTRPIRSTTTVRLKRYGSRATYNNSNCPPKLPPHPTFPLPHFPKTRLPTSKINIHWIHFKISPEYLISWRIIIFKMWCGF